MTEETVRRIAEETARAMGEKTARQVWLYVIAMLIGMVALMAIDNAIREWRVERIFRKIKRMREEQGNLEDTEADPETEEVENRKNRK